MDFHKLNWDHVVTAILVLLIAAIDSSRQSRLDDDQVYKQYKFAEKGQPPQFAYEPLCHSVKRKVELSDSEFEYEPSHYTETICTTFGQGNRDLTVQENRQMCNIPGFECVQQKKDMTFLRRRAKYGYDTWEPYTLAVATHCECMLPKIE